MPKYPVLIPYKQTHDDGLELRYTLRSLKNIKQWNGEVIICGDKPDWVQNVTHVTARPSNNRYIDAELKIRAGLEVAPETFIFMNDDVFCSPRICFMLLNDGIKYDIIDIYEMYNKWMREEDSSQKIMLDALPETNKNRRGGRSGGNKSSELEGAILQGHRMQEADTGTRVMSDAQKKAESVRTSWRAGASSRISWDEVDKNIQDMAKYETEMHKSEYTWLQELRWKGDNSMQEMAYIFWILRRNGSLSTKQKHRAYRQRKGLLKRELHVGDAKTADEKHSKDSILHVQRAKEAYGSVDGRDWAVILQIAKRGGLSFGESLLEIKDWYAGELKQTGAGPHQANRLYTRNWLLDRGYTPLDYSLHTPMIMNRDKRKQVSDIVMQDHSREQFRTLLARTLYGSMFIKDPELRDDHKIRGKDFVSNDIISTNGFMTELHDLFPEQSKFEADIAPGNYSVSVIMPVYNEEELLTKALNSIPKNVAEIVVVNDGSTDDTLKIAREWAKTDTRAKVYSNRGNKGVGYTINRCYDLATSDYTVILSGDDYMHPEMQQVINRIDGSDMVFFNLSYNIKGKIRRPTPKNYKSWAGSCKLVRREFMEGVRASDRLVNEDLELYQMLLAKPHTTQFTDIMGKHYNTPREGSLTDRKQRGEFGEELVTVGTEAFWRRYNEENKNLQLKEIE